MIWIKGRRGVRAPTHLGMIKSARHKGTSLPTPTPQALPSSRPSLGMGMGVVGELWPLDFFLSVSLRCSGHTCFTRDRKDYPQEEPPNIHHPTTRGLFLKIDFFLCVSVLFEDEHLARNQQTLSQHELGDVATPTVCRVTSLSLAMVFHNTEPMLPSICCLSYGHMGHTPRFLQSGSTFRFLKYFHC